MENPSLLPRILAKISGLWEKIVERPLRDQEDSSATPIAKRAYNCSCTGKLWNSMDGILFSVMMITVTLVICVVLRDSRWDGAWTVFGARNLDFESRKGDEFFTHKDNLMGDLLRTGFDKKSCRSRFESASYRRGASKNASPDLILRLRRYEALHKKCGPYTYAYNRSVENLRLGRSQIVSDCKYVVWLPLNGLGNRIISIASSFLYALLTDRVLLVDRGFDLPDLFCEPFLGTSWLLPLDFPLASQFKHFHQRSNESYGNKLKSKSFSNSTDPYMFIYLGGGSDNSDKLFYCNQDQRHLQNKAWLIIKSDLYFTTYLFLTPYFKEELNNLFPDKEAVFHLLARYLFHPTNSAWDFITRYYQTYLSKADVKVGIQLRIFNTKRNRFKEILNQILSCTIKQNILPEISQEEQIVDNPSHKTKTIAVLITSLNSAFSEELRKTYLEHWTVTGELVSVHQPSHEGYQQTDRGGHNKKAWIEMYLLSLTDKLVTSSQSTFGYVAQGLGGMQPWILHPGMNGMPCQRGVSIEPCFHSSSYYDCKMRKSADSGSIAPYVKHCEDVSWGFKLVHPSKRL